MAVGSSEHDDGQAQRVSVRRKLVSIELVALVFGREVAAAHVFAVALEGVQHLVA